MEFEGQDLKSKIKDSIKEESAAISETLHSPESRVRGTNGKNIPLLSNRVQAIKLEKNDPLAFNLLVDPEQARAAQTKRMPEIPRITQIKELSGGQ
jgi:hypothetical protein